VSVERRLPSAKVDRTVSAPPDDVFDAWLDEAALREFICPAPGRATRVRIDARVGGTYEFHMSLPDRELIVTGEYLALDRPERISLTWRCSDTGDLESVVTITFEPYGDDATRMRITHSMLPAILTTKHLNGWTLVARQVAAHLRALPSGEISP
jgi:uncharacterized protein YndB with AHSA1/START domain